MMIIKQGYEISIDLHKTFKIEQLNILQIRLLHL